MEQTLDWVLQISMGVSLAACAGLRAFLPLLVVGAAGRLDYLPLSGSFSWLESWPALTVFGVAVVCELAADKFPVIDNLLDVVQLWVKPIAGVVLVASVVTDLSPLAKTVLAVALGGGAATAVHLLKAKFRLVTLATTAGAASPVVSAGEDAGALLLSLTALIVPLFTIALLLALALLAGWVIRQWLRGAQPQTVGG